MKSNLLSVALLPVLAFVAPSLSSQATPVQTSPVPASPAPATPSQSAPAPVTPGTPPRQALAAACPLHVEEAYVTAAGKAMPATGPMNSRTLHMTVTDVSGKAVEAYAVHARFSVELGQMTAVEPHSIQFTRRWKGHLEPNTPDHPQWTFPVRPDTGGLDRIWFDKVTFADGTRWMKSANDGCSFHSTGHIVETKQ